MSGLLDLQKMNAGQLNLDLREVSLGELLEEVAGSIDGFARGADVTISTEADPERCLADSDRLVQALVNLVGNAIRFSPSEASSGCRRNSAATSFGSSLAMTGRGSLPADAR